MQSLDWNHDVVDVFTSLEQTDDIFYLDDATNHGWSYIVLLEDPLTRDPWELMDINESKQKKPGPMPFVGGLVGWLSYGLNKGKNWNKELLLAQKDFIVEYDFINSYQCIANIN